MRNQKKHCAGSAFFIGLAGNYFVQAAQMLESSTEYAIIKKYIWYRRGTKFRS
jgi:hypothetical protein